MIFCPDGTDLRRGADVTNPRPGTTVITQDFTCVDDAGDVVEEISALPAMGVRFVEYIGLGYLLLWLNRLYVRMRLRRATS